MHARGMRILGDLTTNHTGAGHEWFARAQADRAGEEASFYYWTTTTRATSAGSSTRRCRSSTTTPRRWPAAWSRARTP